MSLAVQSVVQQMFCGDEVKGAVIDIGDRNCRFGFAGQDVPRYRFRSDVGVVESTQSSSSSKKSGNKRGASAMDVVDNNDGSTAKLHYVCGDQNLRYIRSDINIDTPFTHNATSGDTEINWDILEQILQYGITNQMAVDPKEYPMLFAENYFQSIKDKNKLFEMCFESMNAPASWIANNAVMAAFSSGRTTASVVDIGSSGTRITPVVDGYALKNATVHTNRGGNSLDEVVSKALAQAGVKIRPWFEVNKDGSGSGAKASAALKQLHSTDVVREVKKWMSFVPYMPVPSDKRDSFIKDVIKLPQYELPDGTMITHNNALCTGAETLFFGEESVVAPALAKPQPGLPAHEQPLKIDLNTASLPELLRASVLRSDIDCRKDLLANTCLVGGGSLIDGMQNRLQLESANVFPTHMKCKIQVQLPEERLNAAWIGGSILAICGSFQQMWISKEEWLEFGDTLFTHRLH